MTNEEAIKELRDAKDILLTKYQNTGKVAEAIDIAVDAIDKGIAEKVLMHTREWLCPSCGENLDFNNKIVGRCKCGKAVKWR